MSDDTTTPDRMLVLEIEAILPLWGASLTKEQSLLNSAARELKILRTVADRWFEKDLEADAAHKEVVILEARLRRAEDYIKYITKLVPPGKPPRPYGHNPVA